MLDATAATAWVAAATVHCNRRCTATTITRNQRHNKVQTLQLKPAARQQIHRQGLTGWGYTSTPAKQQQQSPRHVQLSITQSSPPHPGPTLRAPLIALAYCDLIGAIVGYDDLLMVTSLIHSATQSNRSRARLLEDSQLLIQDSRCRVCALSGIHITHYAVA